MPELPEVETVVRDLCQSGLEGLCFQSTQAFWPKTIHTSTPQAFDQIIKGRKIQSISRRAKFIVFELAPTSWLLVHLRMTGRLDLFAKESPLDSHVRMSALLNDNIHWTSANIQEKYGSYVQGYKLVIGSHGAKIYTAPIYAYIICFNEQPIGYIQYYNVHDFPREQGPSLSELPKSCAAIDWYIGEPDYIGQRIGPKALNQFLLEHVFLNFNAVFVDSETANTSAIRAYEKAGFKTLKLVDSGTITWMLREEK